MAHTMKKVRLELARTAQFPGGSAQHGYEFVAPLTHDGHLDADGWRESRSACRVRRFWDGQPDEVGHLVHTRGRKWAFHYDVDGEPDDDETGFKFDQHRFALDEYVSITEHDGETRPFRVVVVSSLP